MKYTIIIICALFSLINPKLSEDSYCDAETKEECLKINEPIESYQCCYMESKYDEYSQPDTCTLYNKEIDGIQNFFNSEEYKALNKEINGYQKYNHQGEDQKKEFHLYCNNGEINYSIGGDEYTENEQKILTDKNLCYNKYYSKTLDYSFDVGQCEDGLLLDSSTKSGFTCGNLLIKIKADKEINFQSCFPFNLAYFSNQIKTSLSLNFKNQLKAFVDEIVEKQEITGYQSFTAEYYNKKGQKFKYDSKTGNFDFGENYGSILKASKYLSLLILILF